MYSLDSLLSQFGTSLLFHVQFYLLLLTCTRVSQEEACKVHANKMDNPEETDKFLETYSLPKLNQEETDNL